MVKSRMNTKWFTPRPIIASMLNNKGIIYMERQQYDEARKTLYRALRLAEKDEKKNGVYDNCNGNDKAAVDASANVPVSTSRNSNNAKSDLFVASNDSAVESERKFDSAMELKPRAGNIAEMSSLGVSSEADTVNASCAPHGSDESPGSSEDRSPFELCVNSSIQNYSNDSATETLPSERRTSPPKSEYDEGMDCFKSPFRLLTNSSRSLSGTILFNLGRASHDQGNFEDALGLYKQSLLALRQFSSGDEALTLSILVGIGKIRYVQGYHVDSLNAYMTALALAQSHFGEDSLEVAACLNCIGVLHYMMPTGDNNIALDALQTSLRQRIKLLGKDHIDVGTTCNNVGRMYFQLGNLDLAMEAYLEALRIRRKRQGESVDVAATIFNCGQVYHNLNFKDQALALFQEFLKLAKIHFGEFHRDICIVTTCIGQILHENNDYEKAIKFFQHALRIGHVALGPVHSEIAIALNKMGNLYYETGNLDSALNVYHKGLEIELAVLEPDNPNIYVTYTNIAEIRKCLAVPSFLPLTRNDSNQTQLSIRRSSLAHSGYIFVRRQTSKKKNLPGPWSTTRKSTSSSCCTV